MAIYRGVSGVNREIVRQFRGVSGVNREMLQQFRGVGGVNREVFGGDDYIFGNGHFYVPVTSTPPSEYHRRFSEENLYYINGEILILDTLSRSNTYSTFVTVEGIDLTDYSFLEVNYISGTSANGGTMNNSVIITKSIEPYDNIWDSPDSLRLTAPMNVLTTEVVNISNLTGNYYLGMNTSNGQGETFSRKLTVYSLKLIK